MKDKYFLYGVIAASIFTALCSIGIIYYSIWIIEETSLPSSTREESRINLDKLMVKIRAGEIPAKDVERVLEAGQEAYEASFESSAGLISIQEGLVLKLEAIILLYLLILFLYFTLKRT
jgi:hypothetical protein